MRFDRCQLIDPGSGGRVLIRKEWCKSSGRTYITKDTDEDRSLAKGRSLAEDRTMQKTESSRLEVLFPNSLMAWALTQLECASEPHPCAMSFYLLLRCDKTAK